jgi:D-alanyl-D-alanine carboxypeptidase
LGLAHDSHYFALKIKKMKRLLSASALLFMAVFLYAQTGIKAAIARSLGITVNPNFSKAAKLDSILKNDAPGILPGASLAVYTETEGWWATASGYANIEQKLPMQNCHLQYIQSVSKMYIAVEILQLKERGEIDLGAAITKYLPIKYSKYIKDAEKITVRMLLNHTSGIHEYNSEPGFVSKVILHPTENFFPEDCLKAIEGYGLQFAPGSKYAYSNTNYLVLTLIADAVIGDHAAFIRDNIFGRLNLKNSFYAKDNDYLSGLNLPESYWDVLNNGVPVNVTPFPKMTVACSKGDDGIVCTPVDAVLFMKGLMEGKLLNERSMKEMMTFVKDEKGNDKYGMGIFYFDFGGLIAYGHGGGGIGAGCGLIYIPSQKTYLFISTNLGVLIDGKLSAKADGMKTEVLMALLQ